MVGLLTLNIGKQYVTSLWACVGVRRATWRKVTQPFRESRRKGALRAAGATPARRKERGGQAAPTKVPSQSCPEARVPGTQALLRKP